MEIQLMRVVEVGAGGSWGYKQGQVANKVQVQRIGIWKLGMKKVIMSDHAKSKIASVFLCWLTYYNSQTIYVSYQNSMNYRDHWSVNYIIHGSYIHIIWRHEEGKTEQE